MKTLKSPCTGQSRILQCVRTNSSSPIVKQRTFPDRVVFIAAGYNNIPWFYSLTHCSDRSANVSGFIPCFLLFCAFASGQDWSYCAGACYINDSEIDQTHFESQLLPASWKMNLSMPNHLRKPKPDTKKRLQRKWDWACALFSAASTTTTSRYRVDWSAPKNKKRYFTRSAGPTRTRRDEP